MTDNATLFRLRMKGDYDPFTRWEVIEKLNSFGLMTLDDRLPYCLDNPDEVVIAAIPLNEAAYDHFDRVVGLGRSLRFVETMGFFVPTYPKDRTHLLDIFHGVFFSYGLVIYDHSCKFNLVRFEPAFGLARQTHQSSMEAIVLARCLKEVLYDTCRATE